MKWKLPPEIKIYEALGCIGDDRVRIGDNEAKVYSSSGNKFYVVKYSPGENAIMANDNGSYWQNYLGYPSIAFLMKIGAISFDSIYAKALEGIAWKDINTQFKNDFDKTAGYVHSLLNGKGISTEDFLNEIEHIAGQIKKLDLLMLGHKIKPPTGY